MRISKLFSLAVALSTISCSGGNPSRGPTVLVAVPNTPVVADTAPPAGAQPPEAASGTVRDRAIRVLSRPADFESAARLEINKQFPSSEKIKDALVRVGAPWKEDDWFGDTPPDQWEVKIGIDVGVPAAQAVIAACALHGATPFRVILMTAHDSLENHRRIYVGALDTKTMPPLSQQTLMEMLKPGLTSERLRELASRIQGPDDGEDGD